MAFDGPRLRRDLVSTILQEDGVRCVDVRDPKRGSTFRLFDYEHSVALAFDGRPLTKVIAWVRLSTGLELTAEQLTAFAERLDQLGFLASDKAGTPGVAPETTPARVTRTTAGAVQTPLPVPSEPVIAEAAVPIASEAAAVKTPVPVVSELVAEKTPLPVPSEPVTAEAAVPIALEAAAVKTPVPVVSELAAEKTPLPVPSQPAPAGDETPAPPATESCPATAEPTTEPPEAEAASTETPSSDALPAGEPPAAVVTTPQPDGPSQVQPSLPAVDTTPAPAELPAVDTTPAPVDSPPPPPASTPVQEPSPVPLDTRPPAVLDRVPSPTPPRARTPSPRPELPPQGHMSAAEAVDGTSRPHVVQGGARMLTPRRRGISTPPPLLTPPPYVTPAPLRPAMGRGGPWILYALLGTLAALALGTLVVPLVVRPHPPAAVRARVLVAKPMAVLRWFDGTASVETLPSQVLSFPTGGKVIRIESPGTWLRSGDVVAATDAARPVLADLARLQERLAYFEQLAEGTLDTGDEKRARAARAKVELSAGLVEQTQAALSRVAVVAQASGQIEATLTTLGQAVRAGAPAVRLRSAGWRAKFELPRTQAARVRKQGFCAAEIERRPVTCSLAPDGGDETHVVIELAPEAATAAGQPARLARARLADAYLLPASALSRVGDSDRVLVVASTGRAEVRSVAVADRTAADAVIIQGLDAGDAVIVETSEPVAAGARVRIAEAMRE